MFAPPEKLNVAFEILRHGTSHDIALRYRGEFDRRDISYDELRRRVRQTASLLCSLGVRPEERVLIVLPDSPEFIYAFLGAIWIGAVPVPVSGFLRGSDYGFFVEDTRARAVVTTEALAGNGLGSKPGGPVILSVGPGLSGSFWQGIEPGDSGIAPFESHRDDAACWLYSSGTTGRPKAAIHLHRNIVHAIEGYGRGVLGIDSRDIVFSTSKMFFAYGLGASLYFPLSAGAISVLSPDSFSASRTWTLVTQERPTLFFSVPSAYKALLGCAAAGHRTALVSVRRSVSAGEGLPAGIFEHWHARFDQEILDGVGSTEMLHIYVSNRPGSCAAGRVGSPVPGYEIKLVDEDGSAVRDDEPGAMLVRGGSMAAGYWHRQELARHGFRGEWYFTGDQAVRHSDGTYRMLGRSDDMLKVSGLWVAPADVEEVVCEVPGVQECAVVGCRGNSGLQELVAVVVRTSDAPEDLLAALLEHCSGRLPSHKRPKHVLMLDALPRTATGKLQRACVREIVEARRD